MKQTIILIRHGQPEFDANRIVGRHCVADVLNEYWVSRVVNGPEENTLASVKELDPYIVSSALARAADSAQLLGATHLSVSDTFNESELPHPRALWISLPWSVVVFACRVGWFFGYQTNASGRLIDERRAVDAAQTLEAHAAHHRAVALVGHGIFNRLVSRALVARGWSVCGGTGRGYWSYRMVESDIA